MIALKAHGTKFREGDVKIALYKREIVRKFQPTI
jgi:hypothetical protein